MKPVATEIDTEQGTDEWYAARLGRATASRFIDIIAMIKNGEAAQRRNYRAELVSERLKNRPYERFKSDAMSWGNDTEELAATQYMLLTGNKHRTCGFFQHHNLMAGASPDRILLDYDGIVEIKCLNTANHHEVLKAGAMPEKHRPQVQGQLWMTGKSFCDFVSFDPDYPPNAQIFIQRILRDDNYIHMLEIEVTNFLNEVVEDIKFVQNYHLELSKEVVKKKETKAYAVLA